MNVEQRILHLAQLAAIAIVALGCYVVLRPFFPAILFAVVVCVSTWPLYLRLRKKLQQRASHAALLMVLLLVLVIIGPSALLAATLVDNVTAFINAAKVLLEFGPILPPAWLVHLPLIGDPITEYWFTLTSGGEEAVTLFTEMLEPTRKFLVTIARAIGESVLQMGFAVFIAFFLFRDGEQLIQMLRSGLVRLAGSLGEELLLSIHRTVASVVQGIFGAALAQAILATAGFFIAGVPGALLLGTATFFLSIIPIGPPLIWGAASVWLFYQDSYGWALFMVLWGILAISSIDNLVRPYLITQANQLSMLLNVFGVFGGIIAFGFIGIFIGPPILVVGLTLVRTWTAQPKNSPPPPATPAEPHTTNK
ncbi:MAG TPA: AI-2E family transporter [Gammaproteobacteria bacterium]